MQPPRAGPAAPPPPPQRRPTCPRRSARGRGQARRTPSRPGRGPRGGAQGDMPSQRRGCREYASANTVWMLDGMVGHTGAARGVSAPRGDLRVREEGDRLEEPLAAGDLAGIGLGAGSGRRPRRETAGSNSRIELCAETARSSRPFDLRAVAGPPVALRVARPPPREAELPPRRIALRRRGRRLPGLEDLARGLEGELR